MTLAERLAQHVSPEPNTGCHLWTGALSSLGYGQLKVDGKTCSAHRVAWFLAHGPIPVGVEPDHRCRNRGCVNTAHMELVTHAVNMHRGNARAGINKRKTHCLRGHPLSGDNVRVEIQSNGLERRQCKRCAYLRQRGEAPPAADPAQPWRRTG